MFYPRLALLDSSNNQYKKKSVNKKPSVVAVIIFEDESNFECILRTATRALIR